MLVGTRIFCCIFFGAILSAEYFRIAEFRSELLRWARDEVLFLFDPAESQWLGMLCIIAWLLLLPLYASVKRLGEQSRSRTGNQNNSGSFRIPFWECSPRTTAFWSVFAVLIILSVCAYALDYSQSSKTTDACVFLAAATLGCMVNLCVSIARMNGISLGRTVIESLLLVISIAAILHPDAEQTVEYHSHHRWSGIWQNPNTFGALMATGFVIACGSLGSTLAESSKTSGGISRSLIYCLCGCVTLVGLVNSFSRSSWLGCAIGTAFLLLRWSSRLGSAATSHYQCSKAGILRKNLAIGVFISIIMIGFLMHRYSESPLSRRILSVINPNDFSWQNRVSAYETALQMIADAPYAGFGWNRPIALAAFYADEHVPDGSVIQLNDILLIAATLGVPALVCFFVVLSFAFKEREGGPLLKENPTVTIVKEEWILAVCQATIISLVIGFWFNGGLFTMALAVPFWILFQLAMNLHAISEAPSGKTPVSSGKFSAV